MQFSSLLERVMLGEHVVIARHGKPVARLVPEAEVSSRESDAAVADLKALRKGQTLGGLSWRKLRNQGRR